MPIDSAERKRELRKAETLFLPIKNIRSVPMNIALVYPNTYNLGMSNLGFHALYYEINSRDDALCHRAFFMHKSREVTVEADQALEVYDIIGFSISFELDYINILKILDSANIPLYAKDRPHHMVMAGGPAATFNPEPLSPFIDFFVIGEGEEVIHEIIDKYISNKGLSKQKILENLAQIEGVYVPSLYDIKYDEKGIVSTVKAQTPAPVGIKKRWIKNLDNYNTESVILTPNTEFGDMFLLEISRGCGRNCRFCMAGYCYRVPRARSLEKIIERAKIGAKYKNKIGLVGAAISDYPDIDELADALVELGIKFSVSSLRADTLREPLMRGLSASNHKTITVAPEAGSQRLRNIINKGITEEHVLNSVELAYKYDIQNVKLYYIIGLPYENQDDIDEMVDFLIKLKNFMKKIGNKSGTLTISVNPFIPKPFTPFQWYGMETKKTLNDKIKFIRTKLKPKGIKVSFESPRISEIQAALSRGDRLTGDLLHQIYKMGASSSNYRKANIDGKNLEFYAHRTFDLDETLPWEHIDLGLKKDYFKSEFDKAKKGIYTRRCTDKICKTCSICQHK